jgi:hypothetical protein
MCLHCQYKQGLFIVQGLDLLRRQHTPLTSSLFLSILASILKCKDHHDTIFLICLSGANSRLAYSKIEPGCACIKPSWIVGIVDVMCT